MGRPGIPVRRAVFSALLALTLAITLTACKAEEIEENRIIPAEYGEMEVTAVTDTPDGLVLTVVIRNNSESYWLDRSYSMALDIYRMGDWYSMWDRYPYYPESILSQPPGSESSFEVLLDDHFGHLRAGHYRLIKRAHVDGLESRPSAPAPDLLVAEFDIH